MKRILSMDMPDGGALDVSAPGCDAYRIRYGTGPLPALENGTHLDANRASVRPRVDGRSLRGAGSRLSLDARGCAMLYGADGKLLLRASPVRDGLLLRSRRAGVCYGGGDSPCATGKRSGLVKTGYVKAAVGNGTSHVPFLWHSSGWAMWALSEDIGATIRPAGRNGMSFRVRNTARLTDLVVLAAPTLADAVRLLAKLCGRPPVPPLWSLGFLFTRWGYKDWDEIREVWRRFRERGHAADAFIYDFECYTRSPDYSLPMAGRADFADFDWNPQCFPDPAANMAESAALGLRTVLIRKPRLGNKFLLRMAAGKGWRIEKWPGARRIRKSTAAKYGARVLDFRRADTREWYGKKHRHFLEEGVAGWWNDEGEQFPTLYYWWNRAQADALARDFPGYRHWSLNRAYTLGLARLGGTVWTGDSKTGWRDLRLEAGKMLNYGLAGMPWNSCDLGGFTGNPSPALMVRYMQAGVFSPVMRAHSELSCTPRYPWNFGARAEAAIRQALALRYRFLPYLYSLAHEACVSGLPPVRPMFLEFPERVFADVWRQWMFGPAFLAAPALDPTGHVNVRLPRACDWYGFFDSARMRGGRRVHIQCALEDMPVWQRAGSVAVLAPPMPHSGDLSASTLEVRVAAGADASFRLIEDDGETLAYRNGRKLSILWTWEERKQSLTARASGSYPGMRRSRPWLLRIVGAKALSGAMLNGTRLPCLRDENDNRIGWTQTSSGAVFVRTGSLPVRDALRLRLLA